LGVHLSDLDESARRQWRLDSGSTGAVIVGVVPKSPAARSRLRPGDVIVSVNRERVESARDVVAAISQHDTERPVLLLVQRDGMERYLAIELG